MSNPSTCKFTWLSTWPEYHECPSIHRPARFVRDGKGDGMANFAGRRVEGEKKGKGSGLERSFMTSATMGKEAYELRDVA